MKLQSQDVVNAWKNNLQEDGAYSFRCHTTHDITRIKYLSRVWKKILKLTKLAPPARLFELGCGGGNHLAKLALNGFEVHGIDCSPAVVSRAHKFLNEVKVFHHITAHAEVADIFHYKSTVLYDMCYHFGVVEHYLDHKQRQEIWERLYNITMPGGYIVSVVPCGQHIMRKMMKKYGIGGYNIPEIDYSIDSHVAEFKKVCLNNIQAEPHCYFGFLSSHPSKIISRLVCPLLFIVGNLFIPNLPIRNSIAERYASSLVVIGRKKS
jgi:SAM-dependent methyltransferase